MDNEILKKSLLKGIPCGLASAVLVVLIRMWTRGGSFTDHLLSVFGILCLICFPISFAISFYTQANKKKEKEKKQG